MVLVFLLGIRKDILSYSERELNPYGCDESEGDRFGTKQRKCKARYSTKSNVGDVERYNGRGITWVTGENGELERYV